MRIVTFGTIVALGLALTGCYESADVTLTMSNHSKDNTYSGKTDPLLAKLEAEQLQNDLDARFDGQTDR